MASRKLEEHYLLAHETAKTAAIREHTWTLFLVMHSNTQKDMEQSLKVAQQ